MTIDTRCTNKDSSLEYMSDVPTMPYFDRIFSELQRNDTPLGQMFAKHVHWGYWRDPGDADVSVGGVKAATDALTEQLFTLATLENDQSILDVGCGFGGTISMLNERLENVYLTGVNIDPRQIERATQEVQPKVKESNTIQFQLGNACKLPFDAGVFDNVFAVECIFHFPSRRTFFAEASRVLKPGGCLVISDFVAPLLSAVPLLCTSLLYSRDLNKMYGDTTITTELYYRLLAQFSGFSIKAVRNISQNTLPTYAAIRQCIEESGLPADAELSANNYMDRVTRNGWLRYMVLAFEKHPNP